MTSPNGFGKISRVLSEWRSLLGDHHRHKHVYYRQAIANYWLNRTAKYSFVDFNEAKGKFVTSDTIFILGSAPLLNELKSRHIAVIKNHNSFGLNYSFLKDEIVPTFFQGEYGKADWARETFTREFSKRRERYQKTVVCLQTMQLGRLLHPRITPELFPPNATILKYRRQAPINLEIKRPFSDSDFKQTFYYRGTITLVLELVRKLGYKKIVLLGVDPRKMAHFFDNIPEMQEYVNHWRTSMQDQGLTLFENMIPKGNKFHPFDVYVRSLHDYLVRKTDIRLYVDFKKSMFWPDIPAYFSGK